MNKSIESEIETEVINLEKTLSGFIKSYDMGADSEEAEFCTDELLRMYTKKKMELIRKSNSEILNFGEYDKRVTNIYERFLGVFGLP